ncbi:hypothetical protein ACHAW6_013711 [Cyclotella cf. meneghiniana]
MDFAGLYGHKDTQDPHCILSRMAMSSLLLMPCPLAFPPSTKITLSTMEAKYVALSMAYKDLLPLVSLIHELSAVGLHASFMFIIQYKVPKDNIDALSLGHLEPHSLTAGSKY